MKGSCVLSIHQRLRPALYGDYVALSNQPPNAGATPPTWKRRSCRLFTYPTYLSIFSIIVIACTAGILWWQRLVSVTQISTTCANPSVRKEWRYLSTLEKQHYITSVQCLTQKRSMIHAGTSRFDDFAYTHVFEGTSTHYAAAFLPWHRYFIFAFEKALRHECNFNGTLPYWDWSLDSEDLSASPIWDIDEGFGGDGSRATNTIYHGTCVQDGPFANSTRHWISKSNGHGFDISAKPHCLSRGFVAGSKKKELEEHITPDVIASLLKKSTYEEFVDSLEVKAHNSIPRFTRGDFFALTAPNDPVFYLHHGQVDRLWWLWQQEQGRSNEYQGRLENSRISNVSGRASLDDTIDLGQIAGLMKVRDLMTTESRTLCYYYM